jgi:lipopolysaccharide/colanic/teichoic acid biosynthesis glycosyltransferase
MPKRLFDIVFAFFSLLIFGGLLLLCLLLASIDTKSFGLFFQKRIGQNAKPFTIFKIKTFNDKTKQPTRFGNFLRKYKLDELPQLINILKGDMTFVGPRPDIPGYADKLQGADRLILQLRPGVTGFASLKYRNEEQLLSQQLHPLVYNDEIIWPDKIRINRWYAQNQSIGMDFKILFHTIFPLDFNVEHYIKSYKITL